MLKSVERAIAAKKLFVRGEEILVAVSGGLDSMVLLHVLARLALAQKWKLAVAHFNHQLRGRSSDADEKLVRNTAKKLKFPFVAERGNVKKWAREKKLSLEMAARELRHDFLARSAADLKFKKIALAHHADDQVELFFVRLLRGAGGDGMAGMKWLSPSSKDKNIFLARPLLDLPKATLAAYAKEQRIAFREDATNAQIEIQRNHLRHELLPWLAKEFQPALSRVILRQMEIVGAEAEFVTDAARAWLKATRRRAFSKLPPALQRRSVQLQLIELGLTANFDLIEQLRERANGPVTISPKVAVSREPSGNIQVKQFKPQTFVHEETKVRLRGKAGKIAFKNIVVNWVATPSLLGPFRLPKKEVNAEHFDADKVGIDITLRHWQPGDRFQPIGMASPVKLQDLFINGKFPRAERHRVLVGVTTAGVLFWVEGLRLAEGFKLDKNTRNQLIWRWKRLC
ncbi:MAG TPA: tRNA lysidine(34) synthetase TilS [Verrucomicrobiae bacterium]|nr:tRNA lysidine(34) synthetase TilS [Verrucomicrobiae bacterium]